MWNAEKWSYKSGMEAFYVILLLLAREPKTQIAGVTMIADFSGMSRKHIATNLEDIKAWVNLISVSAFSERYIQQLIIITSCFLFAGWCANLVSSFTHFQRTQTFSNCLQYCKTTHQ